MNNLERETYFYVRGVIQERLVNDPARMIAFRNVSTYLDHNRSLNAFSRFTMINDVFGTQHPDLDQVYFIFMQDQSDAFLHLIPPAVRYAQLRKVVMMCFCIQFMDLFRRGFSIDHPFYPRLSNAVHLFTMDQMPELHLRAHFRHVLDRSPAFRTDLQERVSRRISVQLNLFVTGYNNPGRGNPPPQV